MKHDHPVAQLLDLGKQVAGEEDGQPLLRRQLAQQDAQPVYAVGIQAIGRLVEDQQPGPSEHGLGEGEALAHAHRIPLHFVVGALGHPYRAEELGDLLLIDRAQGAREKPEVLAS